LVGEWENGRRRVVQDIDVRGAGRGHRELSEDACDTVLPTAFGDVDCLGGEGHGFHESTIGGIQVDRLAGTREFEIGVLGSLAALFVRPEQGVAHRRDDRSQADPEFVRLGGIVRERVPGKIERRRGRVVQLEPVIVILLRTFGVGVWNSMFGPSPSG